MLISQSNEIHKRKRAFSAKAPSTRSRPLSGMTNRIAQKTQLLEGIYTNQSPIKKQKSKGFIFQGINTEELQKFKKQPTIVTTKNREELFEENMSLKRQINKLQEELSILKSRQEKNRRKSTQKTKQMDIEFEKQMYWSGSKSHLIAGIKHQYDKLKKDFIKKSQEYDQLKIALLDSQVPEYKIYSERLTQENQRLRQKLKKTLVAKSSVEIIENQNSKQVNSYMVQEQLEKNKILESKVQELSSQLKNREESQKQKENKIMFLEKLVIQKDNRQFHAGQKAKRMEKMREQIGEENRRLKKKIQQLNERTQVMVDEVKFQSTKEKNEEKQRFSKQIQKKNKIIQELKDQNKYLEGTINKLRLSSSVLELSQLQPHTFKQQQNFRKKTEDNNSSINFDFMINSKPDQNESQMKEISTQPKKRVQQTADKRHSESAQKMRKVPHTQIQELAEFLRYRLIAAYIPFESLKSFFDYEKQEGKSVEEIQWDEQYISMREVKARLQNKPFCLEAEDSELLARYIIQDSAEEYVYCDQGNEHKRQVVKSIIRATIGDYEVDEEQMEKQYQDTLRKYESNILLAVQRLYPNGKITNRKLLDIMKTIGVEASQTFYTVLIGKLAAESQNLNELQYRKVFKE